MVSSYLLSIETSTPLSLGVGVICASAMLCLVLWVFGSGGTVEVFFLCRTSSRPSGSVPSAPSTSLFAETSLGVSLPGSSSSSSSLPLGGQGKRGGSRGAPSVFMRCFLPSRSTLVRREGRECLWAFVFRVRARSFFSSSFGRWGHGSWLSCCRRPYSRLSNKYVT